ncbi:hypothetical protein THAOC_18134, partial [Thalassiosira oceanica]
MLDVKSLLPSGPNPRSVIVPPCPAPAPPPASEHPNDAQRRAVEHCHGVVGHGDRREVRVADVAHPRGRRREDDGTLPVGHPRREVPEDELRVGTGRDHGPVERVDGDADDGSDVGRPVHRRGPPRLGRLASPPVPLGRVGVRRRRAAVLACAPLEHPSRPADVSREPEALLPPPLLLLRGRRGVPGVGTPGQAALEVVPVADAAGRADHGEVAAGRHRHCRGV